MRSHTRLARELLFGILAPVTAVALLAACGSESTKPTPELAVMGAIQLNRAVPDGGPYHAGVVVSVDGTLVTDATVSINDVPLSYHDDPAHPDQVGYVGLLTLSAGEVAELRVSCSAGERTSQAVVPGFAEFVTPAVGSIYQDDDDVLVTWTPAANTQLSVVTCGGSTTAAPALWVLPATATSHTIPASVTDAPGNRISVINLNGSGDLPSEDLRTWTGQNGFWATSEASADIQVQ